MRFGVVTFPGTTGEADAVHALTFLGHEADYVWHRADVDLSGYDAIVLPGGFSYGDYLRPGALAARSPIMDAVAAFAQAGKPVIGIGNGFQILCEAGLLPGVLVKNRDGAPVSKYVTVRVEDHVSEWLSAVTGSTLSLPLACEAGNFLADEEELGRLWLNRQIVLVYSEEDGTAAPAGSAPTGSMNDIAGVSNEVGNVLGLMVHPERATDGLSGSTDGALFFSIICACIEEALS